MKTDSNEIGMIAACLADNFCAELYEFANSHNLFGYLDTLNEISTWAHLFYFDYDKQMKDWEKFEASNQNIYNALCWDDFLIAWGADQLKQFKQKH